MSERKKWGTWEELLLAGAILRHGTDAWNSVSEELNSRNFFFTIEECRARYEDIQEQYSVCNAWLEELRKRRVAELKRELEKTEDSIGSLHSKLESLTSDRETRSNSGCNASNTELASPIEYTNVGSSVKVVSTDESSAGSLVDKCKNNRISNSEENNPKMTLEEFTKENFSCGCFGITFGKFKKKRGQRKRKFCNNNDDNNNNNIVVKENSLGDSAIVSSAANVDKSSVEDDSHLRLTEIMDLVTKHEAASLFKCRLEIQKRARYRKMIRRHVDFRSIRMRITNGSVSSLEELFRDLLLLCNNAIVFFPKNSHEHDSALALRRLVNKILKERLDTYDHDKNKDVKEENESLNVEDDQASMATKSPMKKGGQRVVRKRVEGVNRARKRSRK